MTSDLSRANIAARLVGGTVCWLLAIFLGTAASPDYRLILTLSLMMSALVALLFYPLRHTRLRAGVLVAIGVLALLDVDVVRRWISAMLG